MRGNPVLIEFLVLVEGNNIGSSGREEGNILNNQYFNMLEDFHD